MSSSSPTAAEAARRLWARAADGAASPEEAAAAAASLCGRLHGGLGRWIGNEGYRALLGRAFAGALPGHPALEHLDWDGALPTRPSGPAPGLGSSEVAAAMEALLTHMIEVLGRIIGDEMAVRLMERAAGEPGDGVSTETEGGRNA